jgi:twinkle protein
MSIVGDEPCPSCRAKGRDKTGNHLLVFADGNKYCNRCHYKEVNGSVVSDGEDEVDDLEIKTVEDVQKLPFFGIPDRKISAEACEQYGVRTEFDDKGEAVAWYYPHTKDGRVTGYKRKDRSKRIVSIGDTKSGELFGQASISGGSMVVITEGEEDCLAVWDVLRAQSTLDDWKPSVLSIAHGATSALRDISTNLQALDDFERVVLYFDQDDAGQKAANEVAPLLGGRAYLVKTKEKDACDMVRASLDSDLKWAIVKHAKRYQPDGIIDGAETWDRYKHSSNVQCIPYPEGWKELNRKTYGFRPGSVVTITSGTGVGKSQFMRELKYHVWQHTDWRIADVSLEEDVGDSVSGIMSLHMGQRLHLPDVRVEEEHEKKVHKELFGSGRWSFYDHFGGMDDSSLFSKLRFFGATGHRAIFLDHLSIVVSEFADQGDERQRIDSVMTKLAKLAKELEIVIFIVVHLRKEGGGRSFEQGAVPTLDDLRGSGSLKQLSWDVIALSRNQQHPVTYCRNISKVTVLKCRFSGRTGEADYLLFDESTGRMTAVSKPRNYETEE